MGSPSQNMIQILLVSCFLFFFAVPAQGTNKIVGGEVSFRPDTFNPPVNSIIWKHRSTDGTVVKAIEWDDEEKDASKKISIPNPKFQGKTSIDPTTGKITINNLQIELTGVYTIDINSKEQEQKFTLTVKKAVPVPKLTIDSSLNPDVVYLYCNYDETITWRNSTGILAGTKNDKGPVGEFIKVTNSENPDNYYTCTLENAVSNSSSDRVYERDLFKAKPSSGHSWIAPVVIVVVIMSAIAIFAVLYRFYEPFRNPVQDCFGEKPCIGTVLNLLYQKKEDSNKGTSQNAVSTPLNGMTEETKPDDLLDDPTKK